MLIAGSAQADVFNMGGTRDPATGTWTGQASLEFVTVGDPGNAADTAVRLRRLRLGRLRLPDGQVRRDGRPVLPVPQRRGEDGHLRLVQQLAWPRTIPTIGITQSGSSGSYSYSVTGSYSQAVNCPIFDVSWGDAARFCNWLQNGQPTGAEGPGTTETGAYTLNGAITDAALMAITRNAGATYFIPSENEWYKAAYYKGGGTNAGYWTYPTQSNTAPINTLPDTGNNANFYDYYGTGNGGYTDPTNYLTPVGAFAARPARTARLTWAATSGSGMRRRLTVASRGVRGGDWCDGYYVLASSSTCSNTCTRRSTMVLRGFPRGKCS